MTVGDQDTTPRMRGLPGRTSIAGILLRYNPAYAGTTVRVHLQLSQPQIQPRVCGDYLKASEKYAKNPDTTPRMRGLQRKVTASASPHGYNPAYAGTTRRPSGHICRKSIQPRVCGDYQPSLRACPAARDTTPRMRGLLVYMMIRSVERRYNPAYAGTTGNAHKPLKNLEIQPRVCGDYTNKTKLT